MLAPVPGLVTDAAGTRETAVRAPRATGFPHPPAQQADLTDQWPSVRRYEEHCSRQMCEKGFQGVCWLKNQVCLLVVD